MARRIVAKCYQREIDDRRLLITMNVQLVYSTMGDWAWNVQGEPKVSHYV